LEALSRLRRTPRPHAQPGPQTWRLAWAREHGPLDPPGEPGPLGKTHRAPNRSR
jgi:hypothetical protein